MMTDVEYWDKAALDPDVDEKYIANVDLGECLKAIKPHIKSGNLLEIGSGVGRLSIPLARSTKNTVVGVDISPAMRKIAMNRAIESDVRRCRFIDVETFVKLESETFDSAYSMLTFQHIHPVEVMRYFQEVSRLLKSGGIFRFQFVEGKYHAPQDHNYYVETIVAWLEEFANLSIKQIDKGLILPQWIWITAVKEGKYE